MNGKGIGYGTPRFKWSEGIQRKDKKDVFREMEVMEASPDPQKPREKEVPARSLSVGPFTKEQI